MHITSTDISEESFPKLKTIIGRHFKYASAVSLWLMLLLFMLLPQKCNSLFLQRLSLGLGLYL